MIRKNIKKILNNLFQDHFDKKLILQAKYLANINRKKKLLPILKTLNSKFFHSGEKMVLLNGLFQKQTRYQRYL